MSIEGKIKGSVKSENIFKEAIKREDRIRMNWEVNWKWFVDSLREREKLIAEYKKAGRKAKRTEKEEEEEEDPRSVLPFPIVTSKNYGWLASKKEFELEIFGSYYDNAKLTANAPDASSSIFYSVSDGYS